MERLAHAGVREITLIGQNVNAYHGEGPDGSDSTLGRLLFRLAEVPQNPWETEIDTAKKFSEVCT